MLLLAMVMRMPFSTVSVFVFSFTQKDYEYKVG